MLSILLPPPARIVQDHVVRDTPREKKVAEADIPATDLGGERAFRLCHTRVLFAPLPKVSIMGGLLGAVRDYLCVCSLSFFLFPSKVPPHYLSRWESGGRRERLAWRSYAMLLRSLYLLLCGGRPKVIEGPSFLQLQRSFLISGDITPFRLKIALYFHSIIYDLSFYLEVTLLYLSSQQCLIKI